MKLITQSLTDQLLANGRAQRAAMDKGEDSILRLVEPFGLLPSLDDGESKA
jgi:hypothetical protein